MTKHDWNKLPDGHAWDQFWVVPFLKFSPRANLKGQLDHTGHGQREHLQPNFEENPTILDQLYFPCLFGVDHCFIVLEPEIGKNKSYETIVSLFFFRNTKKGVSLGKALVELIKVFKKLFHVSKQEAKKKWNNCFETDFSLPTSDLSRCLG